MNNLDLLFQASLLVESEKLHEVDKFSVVSKDLKSSIGGRMTAWTILRELLCSAEGTIQSTKANSDAKDGSAQLKRYLGDFSNLVSIIVQLYTQEVEFLHAVKRQIVDVFSAKNELLQGYAALSGGERKAQAADKENKQGARGMCQRNQKRCAAAEDHGSTEAAARNAKQAVCKEEAKAVGAKEGKASGDARTSLSGRLTIKIPIHTVNDIDRKAKAPRTNGGKERCSDKLERKRAAADNDEGVDAAERKLLKDVEGTPVSTEKDVGSHKPNDKTVVDAARAEACGASTRSLRRNRKRRSVDTENEGVGTKRRRINWTAEENKLFIELVSKFQPLGEAEMRRRVARHFCARRTHEQCANHLRILRAKGVIAHGDDAGASEAVAAVGCGHTSRGSSVTLSKDSQWS